MEVIVPTQWEYCVIVSVTPGYDGWLIGNPKPKRKSRNYQPSYQRFSEKSVVRGKFDGDNPNSLAKELFELGSKGWELVSVDQGIMYFKRPIY